MVPVLDWSALELSSLRGELQVVYGQISQRIETLSVIGPNDTENDPDQYHQSLNPVAGHHDEGHFEVCHHAKQVPMAGLMRLL